ncbi:glycerophosphodiester phosphodiesterase family protein [Chelativorans sp. AA-79]|uniref:glycerophosphodiester phosphodiesterase n=1 Tax=Chelativorans sp. AA-79 TaxID=3028735 RepID=UPI0023F76072|nr:glycerophosphodiester phosphodiesterase family protein [Chelativorans sp. AA-79]WEX08203.1 glycerophosphodiester phosphodiesterase family protein [Chelativorans sp. AA-79]
MGQGISITYDGRPVALKWHRLRRRMANPLFSADNLREGMRLGASMEIDLRVTRDFDFAVLHDETLDRETDGRGTIRDRTAAELAPLHYDDAGVPDTARYSRRLVLLNELERWLEDGHPDALLQFDMKDDLEAIGQEGVDRLVSRLAGKRLPLIISADCDRLILALSQALPEIRRGVDPTNRLIPFFRRGDTAGAVQQLRSELTGLARPEMIYLSWPLLLKADEAGVDLTAMCHDAGKTVDAWTFTLAEPNAGFSDEEWRSFERLLQFGVDQVTTDEAIATEAAFLARTS